MTKYEVDRKISLLNYDTGKLKKLHTFLKDSRFICFSGQIYLCLSLVSTKKKHFFPAVRSAVVSPHSFFCSGFGKATRAKRVYFHSSLLLSCYWLLLCNFTPVILGTLFPPQMAMINNWCAWVSSMPRNNLWTGCALTAKAFQCGCCVRNWLAWSGGSQSLHTLLCPVRHAWQALGAMHGYFHEIICQARPYRPPDPQNASHPFKCSNLSGAPAVGGVSVWGLWGGCDVGIRLFIFSYSLFFLTMFFWSFIVFLQITICYLSFKIGLLHPI